MHPSGFGSRARDDGSDVKVDARHATLSYQFIQDEETVDLGGITVFKARELPGQKAVEGVGDLVNCDLTALLGANEGRRAALRV
jgi:hypothetical protein